MASKTNLPSLIDMVLEYKLGRTNQVADALSRRSWRHLSVRQWQLPAGSRVPYRIVFEMGLKKDPREAFCTKLRNAKQKKDRVRESGKGMLSTDLPLLDEIPKAPGLFKASEWNNYLPTLSGLYLYSPRPSRRVRA